MHFFFQHSIELPIVRDTAALKIRVLQEQLLPKAIEQLALAPTVRPATLVCRKFFMSPGKMQIEMCLDKAIYYLGDKLVMNVIINNSSNRTIRKIKVLQWRHKYKFIFALVYTSLIDFAV